jgi:cyanophycin synthetase
MMHGIEENVTLAQRPSARVLPLVAVGGRWGKTTTARLLEALLHQQHQRLAIWTDHGVWINGRRQSGELIPWGTALRALAGGELDFAIQELDARTVVAAGLPPAAYGLGIITSLCNNDRRCEQDERTAIEHEAQLAIGQAINPAGTLVLNADDQAVALTPTAPPTEVIYYGAARSNPVVRAHLALGRRAVTISSGMLVLCEGRHTRPVVPVREIALALHGALGFQVQNALAAVAAGWALGVPTAQMAQTLYRFTSAPTMMPGACNQFEVNGALVLVDRFRDTVSARLLFRGLRKVAGRRRRLAVLSEAQLDAESAVEVGRLLGGSFDQVILHREAGAGGRAQADPAVTRLLLASIARAKMPPIVRGVAEETTALERLLGQLQAGDLALILAADQGLALRALLGYRARTDAAPAVAARFLRP